MPESTRKLKLLAIVPALNEEDMVGRVVRDINRHAPDFDVVVIDDGSVDNTVAVAEAMGAVVIRHPFNLGIGGAMQSGYKFALRNGYDVAVQVDGDGQHKPEYLPEMLEKLRTAGDDADMVYGTRFRGDPGYKVPIGRRVGNLIFAIPLTLLVRQRITDPTSGFRMTNRKGIELFARDYPHDYPEVEAILMLHHHRLRIQEVQVRMNARGFGRSSIDYPRAAYYMAKVMLALFVGLLRRRPTPMDGKPARDRRVRVGHPERRDRGRSQRERPDVNPGASPRGPPLRGRRVEALRQGADHRRGRHGAAARSGHRPRPQAQVRRALRAAADARRGVPRRPRGLEWRL